MEIEKMQPTLYHADPILAPMLFEWRQDSLMRKYNPLSPSTVEELRARLSKSSSDLKEFKNAEAFFWFIKLGDDFVGNINCQNLNKTMLTAEVGYNIISSARGKGIATKVLIMLTQNIFENTPIRKLIAYVHEDNIASIKVLEHVGYQREGLLRQHYLVNGEPANELIYGALRSDLLF